MLIQPTAVGPIAGNEMSCGFLLFVGSWRGGVGLRELLRSILYQALLGRDGNPPTIYGLCLTGHDKTPRLE